MPNGVDAAGNCGNDGACQIVLDGKDVFEVAVIPLRPDMITTLGFDQLRGHANAVTRFAHAALNDISNAGADNPDGYLPMLWLFGLLSLAGIVFSVTPR